MVDATKYASKRIFIKVDDVEFASITATIAAVEVDDRYARLVLIFDDGRKLSLNKTNTDRLINAFGEETNNWVDHDVELAAGELPCPTGTTRSVVVQPINGEAREAAEAKLKAKAKPEAEADFNDAIDMDEVPFAP